MEEYQKKAWSCLLDIEKQSLYLNFSQGLSSRKAGEMLKLAHYKYLEVKARSERFFKLFSDYFHKYPDLVDPKGVTTPRFRDYLYACIYQRMKKNDALYSVGDSKWLLYKISTDLMSKELQKLKDSKEGSWDHDLYKLLIEFDRWNNFRILPRKFQAISAFGRKTQKKYKSYVQYLHRIPDSKIRAMVDKYWYSGKKDVVYVTMLSNSFDNGYIVMPIRKSDLSIFSQMRIYAYEDSMQADMYGVLLIQFHERTLNRRDGLCYWKEYREVIEKSINYAYINNLDFGYITMDSVLGLKRKKYIRSQATLDKNKKSLKSKKKVKSVKTSKKLLHKVK